MADLLPDSSVNLTSPLVPRPGPPISTLKPIDPHAKVKLAAADPFSGMEEVTLPAPGTPKFIDPHAKEKLRASDPFSGLVEVDPFANLAPADELDIKDSAALANDDNFHPGDYLASNPNIRQDAEKSQKLLDVYRAKRVRGLEAGKVLNVARKEALPIVGKTLVGARDLAARAIELGVQPAVTSLLSTLTGATPEEKSALMAEQGKEQLKAGGEIVAGTESAVTGLSQLAQQGSRKVKQLFGTPVNKLSDSELLDQLYLDSEFSKATKEVAEGKGDVAKAAGLDAETLAKNGVTLDKAAIENLSLVDPLTLVATAGAFKVVGLGGKVIASAATKAGARAVIQGLTKIVQTVGATGIKAIGRTVEVAGQAGKSIAEKLPAKSVGFLIGATKTGTLHGGAIGAAAGEAVKRIGAETAGTVAQQGAKLAEVGSQLSPGFIGPRSAGVSRVLALPSTTAGQLVAHTAGGAAQGAVTALPLVAASEDSQTAGTILGGAAALGAIHGAGSGTGKAVAETVAKNYLDPHNIPFEKTNSPGYRVNPALDLLHEEAIKKLPESEQNAVNTFREAVRAGGGEIYVQSGNDYLNRIRENLRRENGGEPLTPEQESQAKLYADTHAFFDGQIPDAKGENRRVVFLNSDSTGLNHDAGHLFQSLLSPENQTSLRESALASYSPEQLQAFKDEYARRIGEPDYFSKLGNQADAKAADELIAENFSQLFQNQSLNNLSAPRSFLKKLGDTAVKAGEALGLDLTAGRTTADLGVKPSFRLQDLLRNAAQDVLTRKESPTPESAPKSLTLRPEDVARREANVPVAKEITPESVKPAEVKPAEVKPAEVKPAEVVPESTAKNIRVTRPEQADFASKKAEETGIVEAQKATESDPETRKVVDTIAESMQTGNPVVEVEHRGIVSERGPANPEGRTSRRGTQEAGYQELERLQLENRKEAPADIVDLHQKTFVPVRFTTQGGKPTLIAMSLDKVIANVRKVVSDTVKQGAEKLLPYPVENGKLTDAGWRQAVEDIKAYSENQSNGYRGDGKKLSRPTEDIGVSLPAENPDYTPKPLSESAMNFANLVQGLAPPETGRVQKGLTPGNVKGQILSEINAKQPMTPSVITPEQVQKQAFKGFEPRTVKETNPLRNELAARGVKVRELTEVTERLAVQDIASVKPRPDLAFKAPVTDIIRGGFLPGELIEKNPSVQSEIDKIKSGEREGQTFNLDGSIFSPGEQKLDVVTLASKNIPLNQLSPQELSKFLAQYKELEKNPAIKPGVFRLSGSNGNPQVSLDLNVLVDQAHRSNTEKFAKDNQQQAIFDLATSSPVETGGTGNTVLKTANALRDAAAQLVRGEPVDVAQLGKEKSVSELGPEIAKMSPEEWQKFTESGGGSLTSDAFKLGMGLKTREDLALLQKFQAENYATARKAMKAGDFSTAMLDNTKAQFFREAYEAATDTGSAANPRVGWRRVMPDAKPPFAGDTAKFLPQTEKGKELAKKGFNFEIKGDNSLRSVEIVKNGVKVGEIQSARRSPDLVEIANVQLKKENRGSGAAEAAYRELLAQLKADGVREVGGMTVAPEPLAIRKKIFGGFDKLELNAEPVDIDTAMAKAAELKAGSPELIAIEATNKITPESRFLPKQHPVDPLDVEKSGDIQSFWLDRAGNLFKVDNHLAFIKEVFPNSKEPVEKALNGGWVRLNMDPFGGQVISSMRKPGLVIENRQNLSRLQKSTLSDLSISQEAPVINDAGKEILEGPNFLPKQKRDEQNRPLTKEGLVDYEKLYAEKSAASKKQEAADLKSLEGKYQMPADAPKAGPATGWILPDNKFVPLNESFHERFLAENASGLNSRFGTTFSGTPDVMERQDALNHGFVRMRYIPGDGSMRVELASSNWNPKTKRAILDKVEEQSDKIDKIYVSLLNKEGGTVDFVAKSVTELSGPERFSALSDAVSTLRGGGAKFLSPKISPESLSASPNALRSLWISPKGELFNAQQDHQSFINNYPELFPKDTIDGNVRKGWLRVISGGLSSTENSIFAIGAPNKETRTVLEELHFALGKPEVRISPDRKTSRSSVLIEASR